MSHVRVGIGIIGPVTLLLLGACGAGPRSGTTASTVQASADVLPPLPGTSGVSGAFVGIHNDALIAAGGTGFVGGLPGDGGEQVWYDDIRVLPAGEPAWRAGPRLPRPRANGAAVSVAEGIVLIGGYDGRRCSAAVDLLGWDPLTARITLSALPDLPEPSAFHAAAVSGRTIYVAAGQRSLEPADLIGSFWSLDLEAEPAERRWVEQPECPGPSRIRAAAAVQSGGGEERYVYLFGGEIPGRDSGGASASVLQDAWRFDPRAIDRAGTEAWVRLSDLSRPLSGAAALAWGQTHLLLFGGLSRGGGGAAVPAADQEAVSSSILACHTITDTRVKIGELAIGMRGAAAVVWQGVPVIPGGELSPGVYTSRVQRIVIEPARVPFGFVNYAVLVLYLCLLVAMGAYFSRREKGTDDFFLAGRRIPWWAAGLSIWVTHLSAITFLATPGLTFSTDWLVAPTATVMVVMAPIVIAFYLPFYRRLNVTTAYEYLEKRFNGAVRLFGSASFIAYQLVRMAIILYLPALALAAITGLDIFLCILIMGTLSTLYTVLGGIEAVIWTDVIQSGVLLGGVLIGLIIAIGDAGGLGQVLHTASADGKLRAFSGSLSATELATWSLMIGSLMLQFGPYTTDQAVVQRYLTTRDERSAARGIWLNGLLWLPVLFIFYLLGSALYVFFKQNPGLISLGMQNDQIFPLFVARRLPTGISGLVIAGVFAAAMSSLDSSLHSISTAVTTDFYRRWHPDAADGTCLKIARGIVVAMGLLATASALVLAGFDIRSLFFFFQSMLGLVSSGLVGIFMLGIFTRRATAAGALTGALVSIAVLVWVSQFTAINFYLYAIIGIGTAVAVGYLASLVVGRPAGDLSGLTWHALRAERRGMPGAQ